MIQSGTLIKIIDNTGAKTALCIKVGIGYKRRYAFSGDVVLVSVKSLRKKRREFIKIKKGDIYSFFWNLFLKSSIHPTHYKLNLNLKLKCLQFINYHIV